MTDRRLQAILEANGQWNPDGVSRAARGRLCKDCRRPVMAGLDADQGAMAVRCDPQPLTPFGEVMALFNGQQTYSLEWRGNRYEIDFRDSFRIEGAPAGSKPHVDVIASHKCDVQFTGAHAAESSNVIRERGSSNYDQCPF